MHWFLNPIKQHYFDFEGRTDRKAFWMFALVYLIIYIVLTAIAPPLAVLYALVLLFPTLGITTRRLHDVSMSGWWQLIGLIPVVGLIVMIYFLVREGDSGENGYGPHPGYAAATPITPSESVTEESESAEPATSNETK